ncbi:MAG: allophanate hydrolase [Cyanobacteria bacterium]|nr:allophanate hydrolase [Cyanobacteriota bacterium]
MSISTPVPLSIPALECLYQTCQLTPKAVVSWIFEQVNQCDIKGTWTYLIPQNEVLAQAEKLEQLSAEARASMPLWGIPFSVKDCIDIADTPTSAGCPDFAYQAQHTNPAIAKLLAAGAILIGKTNLDQFATGLVGIRTGYDVPHNSFVKDYIPGGSSSGSAVSVAMGLVSFSIGTDTGGSGRVPAGLNNIVGLKPTRGLISKLNMVDACKTLDCVSVFALTAEDSLKVFQVAKGFNPEDPFSRREACPPAHLDFYQKGQTFRFGVPEKQYLNFFGNADVEVAFKKAVETLKSLGGECHEISYEPFLEANNLLFKGPWVAERYVSVGEFVEANPDSVFPITRDILLKAKDLLASDVFESLYKLAAIKRVVESLWDKIDVLVVPTTGTAYKISEVTENPIELNSNLGYYTNFVNLLDLAAISVPNGFQTNSLPTGVTMISQPFTEGYLVKLGSMFHRCRVEKLGATSFPI